MSAVVTFSWAPCIFFLCVELINEKDHIQHLLIGRVVLVFIGEILLMSLNYTVSYYAQQYDIGLKEHTAFLQPGEQMLEVCSFCNAAVVSCLVLWLPLVGVDLLMLQEILDVRFVFLLQHFTPLNSISHVVLFFIFSIETREELRYFFKHKTDGLANYLAPKEPKVFTLESLLFTKKLPGSRRDRVAINQAWLQEAML